MSAFLPRQSFLPKSPKSGMSVFRAVKAAEKKLKRDLATAEEIAKIDKMRKIHWFEKFYWFISSDNLLVIGGHDAQQNEAIYKKYFDVERDLYIHANVHGASTVVVKNPSGKPVTF